jgi:rhamnosyltransferase
MSLSVNSPAILADPTRKIHDPVPRVAVLLATYNGINYINSQVESLLSQVSCDVNVWVSDDQSTDGTWEWLCERCNVEPRVLLLPRIGRFGNAARNFYRLLRVVDFSAYHYVALSDQDDIWFTEKLALSIQQLREHKAAAVSSNVIALWPNGRKKLIQKAQQQRRLDFLFESAGPGCTYVITAECVASFGRFLTNNRDEVEAIQFHDWMLYAWARSHGFVWHIERRPTMLYRQHDKNEYGANSGWHALGRRIAQVRSGWYRDEILKISRLIRQGSSFTAECAATIRLVEEHTIMSRAMLATKVYELRRKINDRAWLVLACLLGGI